jgi:methyl coenzyme M reductase subunit D
MRVADVWEQTKSHLVLAVVTVFIWMAADQNVREEQSFKIPVRLTAGTAERYAAFSEPPYQVVLDVTMVGRRRLLREFANLVNSKSAFEAVVDESKSSSLEPQSLFTEADIFHNIREFNAARVVAKSVSPRTALVRIDDYEVIPNVAVEPNYGDLKVVAEAVPAKISVRLPRFAAAALKKDPVFRPNVEQRLRDARQPDGAFAVTVPVAFEFENLDPRTLLKASSTEEVVISGRIESLTETRRKGPVQITWSIPDEVQAKYVVVAKPDQNLRRDIEVTGPRGQVEQLSVQKIRGFVEVMAADEPNKDITRAIRFVLPEGFSLASDPSQHEITFVLVPRATTPAAGG